MGMNYPLTLKFKRIAIAQQITVTDVQGNVVLYVKQKAFKIKEDVAVFADAQQSRQLYTIKADRILDFNARYTFADAQGTQFGAVKRQGVKSLFKSHYDVLEGETVLLSVTEENPWIKVVDQLVGEIPVVGMFTGYLFHPSYLMSRAGGAPVLRLKKEPALFESSFTIQKLADNLAPKEETSALLALLMMVLLERSRG
jgi:hypothetical protein